VTNPYRAGATAAAFLLLLAVPFIFSSHSASAAETKKPNIVFILTDNLGYGELGVYGGGELRAAPHEFQCGAAVHTKSLGHDDREASHPLGNN